MPEHPDVVRWALAHLSILHIYTPTSCRYLSRLSMMVKCLGMQVRVTATISQ